MSMSVEKMDSRCSICFHRFYDPIILNCGHTFDRSCLQSMIDCNQSFKPKRASQCPLCSREFDPEQPLTSNKTLTNIFQSEPTYEWFLIDISSVQEKRTVLRFLKNVFDQRNIFQSNHITFETDETRMTFNANTNFEEQLTMKSLTNLGNILQETCSYLQERDGQRKICILTDGRTKHVDVTKVDSNVIHQRLIIQIGEKNAANTRQLADQINFQFEYFNEKTRAIYVQHFLTHFCT